MRAPMVAEAKALLAKIRELDQMQIMKPEGCEPGASGF
jgi:hypothetical protein